MEIQGHMIETTGKLKQVSALDFVIELLFQLIYQNSHYSFLERVECLSVTVNFDGYY